MQVAAPVRCEDSARAFYGDLLELEEIDKPEALALRGGVWFAMADGRQLHIGVVSAGFVAATKAHPALLVNDIDEQAAQLSAAGHCVDWADPTEIPGRRRFFTADPWGNRLEFVAAD